MSESSHRFGVSVVICCHNSAPRLRPTLDHLQSQHTGTVPWEVIVVDNASSDETSRIAAEIWNGNPICELRVVTESTLGLIHARLTGIKAARYPIVSFIDDDNWVCDTWVNSVAAAFEADPNLGATGSINEPVFESAPPPWFEKFSASYAVGDQHGPGEITWSRCSIWGAGLSLRVVAMTDILSRGYAPTLTGVSGTDRSRGEDTELTYWLVLCGWKLSILDRLRLRHFISNDRLTLSYLKSVAFGTAQSKARLDSLRFYLENDLRYTRHSRSRFFFLHRRWSFQTLLACLDLLRGLSRLALSYRTESVHLHRKLGRLYGLWKDRRSYAKRVDAVGNLLQLDLSPPVSWFRWKLCHALEESFTINSIRHALSRITYGRIPTGNGEIAVLMTHCGRCDHHLTNALESILAQDFPASRINILIAGPNTSQIERVSARARAMGCKLKSLEHRRMPGAEIKNEMLNAVESEYVLFSDCQIVYSPTYFSDAIKQMERRKLQAIVCECKAVALNRVVSFRDPGQYTLLLQQAEFSEGKPGSGAGRPWRPVRNGMGVLFAPRHLLAKVGGFDERYRGFEHIDLVQRLFWSGVSIESIDGSASCLHQRHDRMAVEEKGPLNVEQTAWLYRQRLRTSLPSTRLERRHEPGRNRSR